MKHVAFVVSSDKTAPDRSWPQLRGIKVTKVTKVIKVTKVMKSILVIKVTKIIKVRPGKVNF